jgi:hypothetical protein
MPVTITEIETDPIPWNATDAQMQAALEQKTGPIDVFGVGNVSVTKSIMAYTVTFQGTLVNTNVPMMRVGTVLLERPPGNVNPSLDIQITEITQGNATTNEVQEIDLAPILMPMGGTFTLKRVVVNAKPPEIVLALRWVENTLKGDSVLTALVNGADRIYPDTLPATPPGIAVVYTRTGDQDVKVVGAHRLKADCLITVKVVARSSRYSEEVIAAGKRITELLDRQTSIPVADGLVLSSSREQEVAYHERNTSGDFKHLGGLFAISVKEV